MANKIKEFRISEMLEGDKPKTIKARTISIAPEYEDVNRELRDFNAMAYKLDAENIAIGDILTYSNGVQKLVITRTR